LDNGSHMRGPHVGQTEDESACLVAMDY